MRVRFPTSRTTPVITLGRGERALWQTSAADARDIDSANKSVSAVARTLIADGARSVEVYAPKAGGGSILNVFNAADIGAAYRA